MAVCMGPIGGGLLSWIPLTNSRFSTEGHWFQWEHMQCFPLLTLTTPFNSEKSWFLYFYLNGQWRYISTSMRLSVLLYNVLPSNTLQCAQAMDHRTRTVIITQKLPNSAVIIISASHHTCVILSALTYLLRPSLQPWLLCLVSMATRPDADHSRTWSCCSAITAHDQDRLWLRWSCTLCPLRIFPLLSIRGSCDDVTFCSDVRYIPSWGYIFTVGCGPILGPVF